MSLSIIVFGSSLTRKTNIINILNSYLPKQFDDKNVRFNVVFTNQEQIANLNHRYRKKNLATDVLSFPLNQSFQNISGYNNLIELGDIYICRELAKKNNHQIIFLIIHGFLHLIGLDHQSLRQSQKWDKIEKKIISDIHLRATRDT